MLSSYAESSQVQIKLRHPQVMDFLGNIMTFIELILLVIAAIIIVTIIALIINRKPIPNINSDKDVIFVLQSGDKLKAIRAYRQLHGVGLKEAKESIGKLTSNIKRTD